MSELKTNEKKYEIYNLDCIEFFKQYKKRKGERIGLVVCDMPFGQTSCDWDIKLDMKEVWKHLIKVCKRNCIYVFFCTVKFGNELINSKPNYFKYDLVWEKTNSVGFLSANKIPLRRHEMIYIFGNSNANDEEHQYNKDLRGYAEKLLKWIGVPRKDTYDKCQNWGLVHFWSYKGQQFSIPIEKNYQVLIDEYKINEFEHFLTFEELKNKWSTVNSNTPVYNPQMSTGHKPIKKGKDKIRKASVYNKKPMKNVKKENNGERYPDSILKFGYDKEKLHMTQKPVALCEWLIKTYSNEGDLVLDFTMGSGSTGIACLNTNRRFIGVEMDKEIFQVAKDRLEKNNNTLREIKLV